MRSVHLLVAVSLLVPRFAWADPTPVVAIPPGEDHIEALKKGDPAPFTGQLFEPASALRWANFLQQYKLRLQVDVELQKKLGDADVDYQKRLLVLQQERYTTVTADFTKKVTALEKELADPPFYKQFWFGAVIGAVVVGAIVGLTAWGLSASK